MMMKMETASMMILILFLFFFEFGGWRSTRLVPDRIRECNAGPQTNPAFSGPLHEHTRGGSPRVRNPEATGPPRQTVRAPRGRQSRPLRARRHAGTAGPAGFRDQFGVKATGLVH